MTGLWHHSMVGEPRVNTSLDAAVDLGAIREGLARHGDRFSLVKRCAKIVDPSDSEAQIVALVGVES